MKITSFALNESVIVTQTSTNVDIESIDTMVKIFPSAVEKLYNMVEEVKHCPLAEDSRIRGLLESLCDSISAFITQCENIIVPASRNESMEIYKAFSENLKVLVLNKAKLEDNRVTLTVKTKRTLFANERYGMYQMLSSINNVMIEERLGPNQVFQNSSVDLVGKDLSDIMRAIFSDKSSDVELITRRVDERSYYLTDLSYRLNDYLRDINGPGEKNDPVKSYDSGYYPTSMNGLKLLKQELYNSIEASDNYDFSKIAFAVLNYVYINVFYYAGCYYQLLENRRSNEIYCKLLNDFLESLNNAQ